FVAIVAVAGRGGDSSRVPATGTLAATLVRQTSALADRPRVATRATRRSVPSPSEFARLVAGVANEYARVHHQAKTIDRVHCVPGYPGHYMCAYRVRRAGRAPECHLMQAHWTPGEASSFRVVLAGRARACRTVREAVASLR